MIRNDADLLNQLTRLDTLLMLVQRVRMLYSTSPQSHVVRSTSKKTLEKMAQYRNVCPQNRNLYSPKSLQILPNNNTARHGRVASLALAAPAFGAAVRPVARTGVRAQQFVGRGRQKSSYMVVPHTGSQVGLYNSYNIT